MDIYFPKIITLGLKGLGQKLTLLGKKSGVVLLSSRGMDEEVISCINRNTLMCDIVMQLYMANIVVVGYIFHGLSW